MRNFIYFIFLLCYATQFGYAQPSVEQYEATLAAEACAKQSFAYTRPINGYRVTDVAYQSANFPDYSDVILTFRDQKNGRSFTLSGGRVWHIEKAHVDYPNLTKQGVLSVPYNCPFFFADLNFDGCAELITDRSPFGGGQRDVADYDRIYDLQGAIPKDVTDEYRQKCAAFQQIEEYFFMVHPKRQEIICYSDGGAYSGGWAVYKFSNGNYIPDRYVHYEEQHDTGRVKVSVLSFDRKVTRRLFEVTDKATFHREMWNY